MNEQQQEALVEGLLFIVGDEGIELPRIAEVLEMKSDDCKAIINSLTDKYTNDESRGLIISSYNNKFRLTTKKEFYNYYAKLFEQRGETRLSQAALETLAIIAYRGPIARHAIEAVRGVNCENVMYKLKSRDLIDIVGRSEEPGRPPLYQVTEEFMKIFNINSLDELPQIKVQETTTGEDLFK